jgi:hydrogenase nickel incorporation protein HypA/HybF
MHEMTITLSAVEICQALAKGRLVTAVTLEIGELSDVMPEAVAFCFDACTKGTHLEGAKLHIVRISGRGRCACGREFSVVAPCDPCPSCGGYGFELLSGQELRVKELEVA